MWVFVFVRCGEIGGGGKWREARAGVKIEEMGVREREGRVDRLEKEKAGLDGVGGGGWI